MNWPGPNKRIERLEDGTEERLAESRQRMQGIVDLLTWIHLGYAAVAIDEPIDRGARSHLWQIHRVGRILLTPEAQAWLLSHRTKPIDPKDLDWNSATGATVAGLVPPTFLDVSEPPPFRKPWVTFALELDKLQDIAPTEIIGEAPLPMPDGWLI